MEEERMLNDEILLGLIKANSGGGGGGTTDYDDLSNKPQIAGTTLSGNKSLADLGIASASDVETALAGKQDALTAGNYISIANDGTINVTQGIGVYDVYSYEIKSINSGYATKITKRKNGVFESEQDISNGAYSSENRLNVDDRFEFWYTFAGYLWHYKLLVDSNEHQKDEEVSWTYSTLVDYTETFNVSQDSSTDLATKGDIEAAISSAYHHAGTKTCAELVAGLLVAANEGNVYNMTDSGTTTADFIEGAGQPIKAGDNVGIAKISDGVYKFDLLSGFVDTSNFVQKSVTAGLLKNDGTVNDEIEGDVATLKSGFTNLDNEVNGDATVYPYADVITIEDAVPSNLADCSVKIEPVQDLHGYDKPWVGGAGKNEIQMTLDNLKTWNTLGTWNDNVYSYNNVTVTVNTDDGGNVTEIIVNTPQASAQTTFKVGTVNNIGQYWLTGCPADGSQDTYALFINNLWVFDYGPGANANISATGDNVSILVANGATVINKTFNPMLCLSSNPEPKVFAPYTNICPISGHTEVDVQRDGKNLLNPDTFSRTNPSTGAANTNWAVWSYNLCEGGKNYVLNCHTGITSIYNCSTTYYDKNKNLISYDFVQWGNPNDYKFTAPSGTKYVSFNFYNNKSMADYDFSGAQLEEGTVSTDYEPFKGQTYTIALGDTIYGGTVDFDSGVMTVTHQIVDLGTLKWNFDSSVEHSLYYATLTGLKNASTVKSDSFKSGSYSDVYYHLVDNAIASHSQYGSQLRVYSTYYESLNYDGSAFKAAMDGHYACYELATPSTIQLTPQQIQLLKGTNTISASTGQISVAVNGVSGSIGSVQEQVNGLAEDVAEIKPLDYSTTEQKTGQKWIDGKDIYFRVNNTPISIIANDSWYNSGFTGIDTVIDYIVSMTRDSENIGSTFNNGHVDYVNRNNEVLIKGTNFTLTDNYVVVKQILYYTKTA